MSYLQKCGTFSVKIGVFRDTIKVICG
jgi:hypothetical protein